MYIFDCEEQHIRGVSQYVHNSSLRWMVCAQHLLSVMIPDDKRMIRPFFSYSEVTYEN